MAWISTRTQESLRPNHANNEGATHPRGFAFVTFGTDAESQLAAEKLNGTDLDGRQLTVNEAKPKEAVSGGGRAFGGGYQSRSNSRF